MSQFKLYGAFAKVEEQPDGTLRVEGVASSESVDKQGETVLAEAMRKALPEYMRFPALREMHDAWAAGKTMAATVGDDGKTYIVAKVVDAEAIKKVKEGVYAGFSIGGSVPTGGRSKDNPKIIEQIDLVEISLVDRPANPDAVISMWKRDEPPAEKAAVQTSAEPAAKVEKPAVKKGMYQISCAAELLAGLVALQQDTSWEAAVEGDNSGLPAKLKVLAAQFAECLREMVGEETAEIVAGMGDQVSAAAKTGDLAKAEDTVEKKGKRYSKVTAAAIGALHKMVQDCDKGFQDLAYKDDDGDDVESAAHVGELQKRATDAEAATAAAGEALKKVLGERDELKKTLDAANDQLAKAKAQLAIKGSLRAIPISKEEDVAGVKKSEPAPPTEGTPERALYEIKKVQATAGRPLV